MHPYQIAAGSSLSLAEHQTRDSSCFEGSKTEGKARTAELNAELESLQELLYAEGKHRILIVLQALDAGGKDGTIRHVFDGVNPQGVKVASFKKPSSLELSHDYLWRVHKECPAKGEITIFNRSHYEDVLVVRVESLVPEEHWQRRFEHIRNFESMLADEGTIILKFFLNVSKEEQKERFQDRIDRLDKRWKFNMGDLETRAKWDQYRKAYEDAISQTSTDKAPWYVIPADRKWYRNLVMSEIIVERLKSLNMSHAVPDLDWDSIRID